MRLATTMILTALVSGAGLGAASAADLPARTYTKAPALAPIMSWTGCYLGVNVGGGVDHQGYINTNPFRLPNFDLGAERNSGALGGGQIGCDYQAGNWVFGIQGMFDAAGFRGSNHVVPGAGDPQFGNVFDLSARTSWLATATARIGYTITPQTLLYVKGGGAWTRAKLDYTITGQGVSTFTGSETRSGWTVGGGLEYMFAPNWSVFAEYNYMDFGSSTLNTEAFGAALGARPEPIRISRRIDSVMVGVNYRFGGGPVVAKY